MGIDRQEDAIATKILLAISLVLPFISQLKYSNKLNILRKN
ncbi:hypothetical protein [Nostoc sp.]